MAPICICVCTFIFALVAHAPKSPALVEVVSSFSPGQRDVRVSNAEFLTGRDWTQRNHVDRHVTIILQKKAK